jgi:hypothetical protein
LAAWQCGIRALPTSFQPILFYSARPFTSPNASVEASGLQAPGPNHSGRLYAHKLRGIRCDEILGREAHLLELLGVGRRHLSAGDTRGRRLEVVEAVLARERHDLGGDAEGRVSRLDDEQMPRLLDRLDDGFHVERLDAAQVDDFGLDAVLRLELLGGDEGLANAAGEGYDGEVLAGALDLGFADLGLSVGVWIGGRRANARE